MEDKLAVLRNVKVPIWAKVLGWWRNRRFVRAQKKEVVHVATLRAWVWESQWKQHHFSTYILYRNGYGKRWYEFNQAHILHGDWRKHHGIYGTLVVPWMHGEWDDDYMQKLELDLIPTPEAPERSK